MEKKHIYDAEVLANTQVSPGIMMMEMSAPEAAAEARPGQFINIYPKADRLILPRPISICGADTEKGTMTLLYAVVGEGSGEMSKMETGDTIKISSPLGNGFPEPGEEKKNVLLVSGGVGTAPILFMANHLKDRGLNVTAVTGFRKDPLLTEELGQAGCRNLVITEVPNEKTFVGNVVDCIDVNEIMLDESWVCYSCGPKPMLEAVHRYITGIFDGVDLFVSLEERMGCGYGACVGCAVDVKAGKDSGGNPVTIKKKVCKDGPVFRGEEVFG